MVEDSSAKGEEVVEPVVEAGVVAVVELGCGFALVGTDEGVLGGRAHSGYHKRKKKT